MLNSGLNKRPYLCNKIKFVYTKQFNRGLRTLKSASLVKPELTAVASASASTSASASASAFASACAANTVVELSNNELNLELFPIEFDDNSRAILDLPFILGNNLLKLINKKDGKFVDSSSSIDHYFCKKKRNIV